MTATTCPNCDGRKCMGCCTREFDHECAEDCPVCCEPPVASVHALDALGFTAPIVAERDRYREALEAIRDIHTGGGVTGQCEVCEDAWRSCQTRRLADEALRGEGT